MRTSNFKYVLLLPTLLILVVTTVLPILQVVNLSFQRWQITRSLTPQGYVGFDNYVRAFQDGDFLNSLRVTFTYTTMTAFFSIVVGVFIAVNVQRGSIFADIVKALLIFPFAISLTLRGYSYRFMLLEGQGIIDTMLDFLFPFMQNVVWLANPFWALFWMSAALFWAWGPLGGLMILGALNNIDSGIFEAAKVDGASDWRVFVNITLPLLRPMILVVALLITLFSSRMFDLVLTMTAGGPGRATETLNYFIYRVGFQIFDMGYASALAMILTMILIVLSYVYSRVLLD
ncbi:MAG: sugar ABC transporter permease [Deinococcota bacterium]